MHVILADWKETVRLQPWSCQTRDLTGGYPTGEVKTIFND